MDGVGIVKLKLKKICGLDDLKAGLARIRELGMEPVLGDGVSADICCWMEACVARLGRHGGITNAGEFNGFLKTKASLFTSPMTFDAGVLTLRAGYRPDIDRDTLGAHRRDAVTFTAS